MFELGLVASFIVGFLLCWRPARTAIWLFLAYAWLRSDPLDFLLWMAGLGACMLAWKLLWGAPGDERADETSA